MHGNEMSITDTPTARGNTPFLTRCLPVSHAIYPIYKNMKIDDANVSRNTQRAGEMRKGVHQRGEVPTIPPPSSRPLSIVK